MSYAIEPLIYDQFKGIREFNGVNADGQISAMKRNNIDGLEIRGVDGENISDISVSKAKEIKKEQQKNYNYESKNLGHRSDDVGNGVARSKSVYRNHSAHTK